MLSFTGCWQADRPSEIIFLDNWSVIELGKDVRGAGPACRFSYCTQTDASRVGGRRSRVARAVGPVYGHTDATIDQHLLDPAT